MEEQTKSKADKAFSLTIIGVKHWEEEEDQEVRNQMLEKAKDAIAQEKPDIVFLESMEFNKLRVRSRGTVFENILHKRDLAPYARSMGALVLPLDTGTLNALAEQKIKNIEFEEMTDAKATELTVTLLKSILVGGEPAIQTEKAAQELEDKVIAKHQKDKEWFDFCVHDLTFFLREKEWVNLMTKAIRDEKCAKAVAYINDDSTEPFETFCSRTSGNQILKAVAVVGAHHLFKGSLPDLLRGRGIEPKIIDLTIQDQAQSS